MKRRGGEGGGQGEGGRNPVLGIYVTLWDPPHPGSSYLPLWPGLDAFVALPSGTALTKSLRLESTGGGSTT